MIFAFNLYINLALLAFIIRTVRNGFYQVFLWQLKEYRRDRILAHLKTDQGKKLVLGPVTLIKWILLFIIVALIILSRISPSVNFFLPLAILNLTGFFIFTVMWVIEAFVNLKELLTLGWKIPNLTLKSILILLPVFIIQFNFILFGNFYEQVISGPFLDKLLAISVLIFVALINIPFYLFKKIIVLLAVFKIKSLKKLKVIGITGSYGKTSTKEFLATILSEQFITVKTPEFTNTQIGISKFILFNLNSKHEVFIVEMGAYRKGEIKAICNIVNPKIGIITGINQQHLELFGSIAKTKEAKFELIESLPKDGIALFNTNNKYCLEMSDKAKERGLRVFNYNLSKNVANLKTERDHVEFTYLEKNKKYKIKVNLLGSQTIGNLLAAITISRNLGMSLFQIKNALNKIFPPLKTMQLSGSISGMSLIDDTFNANPDGVIAALNYIKLYKGKKILVLTPLIELGKESASIHEEIGETAGKVCDLILLTNINYNQSFINGVNKVDTNPQKVQLVNTVTATSLIKNNLDSNGVVVFEGKEAEKILINLKIKN